MIIILAMLSVACSNHKTIEHNPKKIEISETDSLQIINEIEEINEQNHGGIMELILGKPKHAIQTIGILVYDGVNDLDVMGPRYILGQSMANTQLLSVQPGNIKTVMGVEIVPDATIDEVNSLDILVIPGGALGTLKVAHDEKVLDWVRQIDEQSLYTTSVCTGAWVLGASGLLKGRKASTNWYREHEFLTQYEALPADERYTRDGKYWTSAGVSAGMDMSLAILAEVYSEKYAQGVMLDLEYDPAPPFEGGTPERTVWTVRWLMKGMYDGALNPFLDSLAQVQ